MGQVRVSEQDLEDRVKKAIKYVKHIRSFEEREVLKRVMAAFREFVASNNMQQPF